MVRVEAPLPVEEDASEVVAAGRKGEGGEELLLREERITVISRSCADKDIFVVVVVSDAVAADDADAATLAVDFARLLP